MISFLSPLLSSFPFLQFESEILGLFFTDSILIIYIILLILTHSRNDTTASKIAEEVSSTPSVVSSRSPPITEPWSLPSCSTRTISPRNPEAPYFSDDSGVVVHSLVDPGLLPFPASSPLPSPSPSLSPSPFRKALIPFRSIYETATPPLCGSFYEPHFEADPSTVRAREQRGARRLRGVKLGQDPTRTETQRHLRHQAVSHRAQ